MTTTLDEFDICTLSKCFQGCIDTTRATISKASTDFGKVIQQTPQVVVRPESVNDVVAVIRHAREMEWKISVRGAGHSQGGQSLNQAGIVIDTQMLNKIEILDKERRWVVAGAGTLWSSLVRTVTAEGFAPPVTTDHLDVTIGGTLSIGGVGPASFRHGSQVNQCLGVEVVLGTGEVVWLTSDNNPELFSHILCGLGFFGVIVKVKLRLRPIRHYIQSVYLTYLSLNDLLHDTSILMDGTEAQYMEGFAQPKLDTKPPTGEGSHRYILELSSELDELKTVEPQTLIKKLNHKGSHFIVNRRTKDYLFRVEKKFRDVQRPMEKTLAHPWVEHFLPLPNVQAYMETIAPLFPSTSFLLWPMPTAQLRSPMFALSKTSHVMLVGVLANIEKAELGEYLPLLQYANELGIALNGKRYLSGWVDFDLKQWYGHYGSSQWMNILKFKRQCDPDLVLNSLLMNPFQEIEKSPKILSKITPYRA